MGLIIDYEDGKGGERYRNTPKPIRSQEDLKTNFILLLNDL